ncbi:ectoine hydroxylase (plasmid) [Streptomyces xanthophaeus]|uniref:ectoine hydroxylase n=1 Tax=Streptomyces xanthophaeus TaxID=67385 RepID=UPI00399008FA
MTATGIDRYPTRGRAETVIPRADPVVWAETAAAGPLDAAEITAFERDGFLAFDDLLTAGEVGHYRSELHRLTSHRPGADERWITEPGSQDVKSVFEVHKISEVFARLAADPRLVGRARQILGTDVYIHQSRINVKRGFGASGFYWHSDFETWHAEDGLPAMRTVSFSIALTDNDATNGSLMLVPGSHQTFVGCAGATPNDNYRTSLQMQEAGTPSEGALTRLCDSRAIHLCTGRAGSAILFDCNTMHGSGDNITPSPRSNVFIVYNSIDNTLTEPFAAPARRPTFLAAHDFTPLPYP